MPSQQPEVAAPSLYTAHLEEAEYLSPDVVRVRLGLQLGSGVLAWEAGQYLSLHLSETEWRCYSLANAYAPGASLELHVRLYPEGLFSDWIRSRAGRISAEPSTPADLLRLSGPYGRCIWQPPRSPRTPTLMLATGTGVAPLLALLQEALPAADTGPVVLYWGGQAPQDLYFSGGLRDLEKKHPNFRFVPVMRESVPGWSGRVGEVEQCATADHPDLCQSHVYACGSPLMVRAAMKLMVGACGLREEHFHADPFEHSMPVPDPRGGSSLLSLMVKTPTGDEARVRARSGVSLMAALGDAGLVQGICGGRAACGNCRVKVEERWTHSLAQPTKNERRLLATFEDAVPVHRLSCQIVLTQELNELRVEIAPPFL